MDSLTHFHSRNVYIRVIIRKLQLAIFFTISGFTLPLSTVNILLLPSTMCSYYFTDHPFHSPVGKAHIRQALMLHEEGLRVHGLSKALRKIDTLQEVLKQTHDRSMNKYTQLDEEDDFFELDDVPDIRGMLEMSMKWWCVIHFEQNVLYR